MRLKTILQSLLFAYAMTGLFLFLLAFLVYKFEWKELHVTIGILAVYVCASLLGGRMSARSIRKNKILAGGWTGIAYFILLIAVSCMVRGAMEMSVPYLLTALVMCLGGGILGGVIA